MNRVQLGYYTPKMVAQAARERLVGIEYDAELLRSGRWAVRPKGSVGSMGSHKGILWEVFYTDQPTKTLALQQALHRRAHVTRK